MKWNKKWFVALLCVALTTLAVGGGTLAAGGDEYKAIRGTELYTKIEALDSANILMNIPDGTTVDILGSKTLLYNNADLACYYVSYLTTGYCDQSVIQPDGTGKGKVNNVGGANLYSLKTSYEGFQSTISISVNDVVVAIDNSIVSATNFPRGLVQIAYKGTVGYIDLMYFDKVTATPSTPPPTSATPTPGQGQLVTKTNATLYNAQGGQVGTVPAGTLLQILASQVNANGVLFYNVKLADGTTGWLRSSDVNAGATTPPTPTSTGNPSATPPGFPSTSTSEKAYVNTTRLALRRSNNNDNDSNIIGYFANGTVVDVYLRGATWSAVGVRQSANSYLYGYMMSQYLSFSGTAPTATTSPDRLYGQVNNPSSSYVNLRADADGSSTILGTYVNGTIVEILNYNANWCRVRIEDSIGYMATNMLKIPATGVTPTPTPGPGSSDYIIAVVNNPNPQDRLNLRASPSTSSTSLGRYYNGTQVKVYERGATWCYVEVQGIRGYMMTTYLYFGGSGSTGSIIITPTTPPSVQYAVVKNPVSTQKLNLRATPSTSSTSLGQFYNGTQVKVLRYGTDWCEVEVNGIHGYMMTMYLSFSGSTPSTGGTYAVVKNPVASQKLNLRAEPSTSSRSLGQFYNGTSVKILEYGRDWCRVEVNGMRGYMMTMYLQIIN